MTNVVSMDDYFSDELDRGINLVSCEKPEIEYELLSTTERYAIEMCLQQQHNMLSQFAPNLADTFKAQKSAFVKFGSIAKAMLKVDDDHESVVRWYPLFDTDIIVSSLSPRFFSSDIRENEPLPSGYSGLSWDLENVEGQPTYLCGSDKKYFFPRVYREENGKLYEYKAMYVIAQNGIIESPPTGMYESSSLEARTYGLDGSKTKRYHNLLYPPYITPKANYVWCDGNIVKAEEIVDSGNESYPEEYVYQYNTHGMIPIMPDTGTKIAMHPRYSGKSTLQLFGLAFYQRKFGEACGAL